MMGKLWIFSKCIRSGASCITIVGDWLDGPSEYSPFESKLYIDLNEDYESSSQASILMGFFFSKETLIFSNLDFFLSISLLI
jgi:hypothetical protein